tara:strand:- start:55 stop:1455 length:1401 start_codon:yes stop_codon:yes gene_type:complete
MAFLKFKGKRFTERTASKGTTFKPYYEGISKKLKSGDQSTAQGGFFNYARVKAAPEKYHVEVDDETNEKLVGIEREEYKTSMADFIDANFATAVATNLKNKFTNQMGVAVDSMPSGEFVSFLVAPDKSHPTASLKFKRMPGKLNPGFLVMQNDSTNFEYAHFTFGNTYLPLQNGEAGGIPGQRGQHRFASGSARTTHLTRSFRKEVFLYGQDEAVPEFSVKVVHPTNDTSIYTPFIRAAYAQGVNHFALTSSITTSADYGVRASGSENVTRGLTGSYLSTTGSGLTNYNGVNANDGAYYAGAIKGFVSGEDNNTISVTDNTDLVYIPSQEYYYFSSSQAVQNGVFRYNSSSAQAAKTSGTNTTLYYASASLGNGPSGSYTGSLIGTTTNHPSGSHIFLDANLTTPASAGFYHIPGTNEVLGAHLWIQTSTVPEVYMVSQSVSGSQVPFNRQQQGVPQFCSKSIHTS